MSKLGHQLNKYSDTIIRPTITEKASFLSAAEKPVYTFVVKQSANKAAVKQAIKELYQVTAQKVAIIQMPSKKIVSRGKIGHKPGHKKALVYLKKGDKIDLV